LCVILPGFTLERREDGPPFAARALPLIVAALSRFGGRRGQFARRPRRGLEGLKAAGGAQARNIPLKARSVTGENCAAPGSF